jgi:uncharacterized protein YyaL (SSP411 family)
MQRNRLAAETSPYLKQHADNPVDWYPWGEEAIALAQRENKPILLSVGYSACHWCHVMAHESFEDPATAQLMNSAFVNIKVDREERPDLDKIYQAAQQLITGQSGGWPLTMFLSPEDQRPFFGGTYFPREPRYGMPAFKELLQRVAEYYRSHAAEIRRQGDQLAATFREMLPAKAERGIELDVSPIELARAALRQSFDAAFGGFGEAPKFPHPESIERCLKDEAVDMARLTLTRMAEGGIYDQLGGGFARYSVDASWTIPHFEKMLYDNGQLLVTYAVAAQATGDKLFARIAGETADWLLRDMRSPAGGFYSSLDADSEGQEGKFYVWTPGEAEALLTAPEYRAFAHRFGLDADPNFEGAWHLCVRAPLEDEAAACLVESARKKLLAARNLRIWPQRDEKILTSWNALAVKGLAIAARVLHRPDLADAATAAVDFIHRALWRDGRLLATYKDGHAHLAAYLDDYAFLADALLELLQTRWRGRDLEFARALIDPRRQRRGGIRAHAAWVSSRQGAVSRGRGTHAQGGVAADAPISSGPPHHPGGAGGVPKAAQDRDHPRADGRGAPLVEGDRPQLRARAHGVADSRGRASAARDRREARRSRHARLSVYGHDLRRADVRARRARAGAQPVSCWAVTPHRYPTAPAPEMRALCRYRSRPLR